MLAGLLASILASRMVLPLPVHRPCTPSPTSVDHIFFHFRLGASCLCSQYGDIPSLPFNLTPKHSAGSQACMHPRFRSTCNSRLRKLPLKRVTLQPQLVTAVRQRTQAVLTPPWPGSSESPALCVLSRRASDGNHFQAIDRAPALPVVMNCCLSITCLYNATGRGSPAAPRREDLGRMP